MTDNTTRPRTGYEATLIHASRPSDGLYLYARGPHDQCETPVPHYHASRPSDGLRAALDALDVAFENYDRDKGNDLAAMAVVGTARRLRAALATPADAGERLDVDAAVGCLMRAGLFRNPDYARNFAIDLLLTAQTGERYDVDDEYLTPDQRRRLRAYSNAREEGR